ncbi:MAG: hypothetical protein EXQ55_09140 [Acidobacteria bacterium]|nr:hypothetical protein [Acidobacteriota bacterium]
MAETLEISAWIRRVADDERQRDAVSADLRDTAARKADLLRVHGRKLLDGLHATMVRDVRAFRAEFPNDPAREIVCGSAQPDGGFVVRKPESPGVSLTLAPRAGGASIGCGYHFRLPGGLPPREVSFDLVFEGEDIDTLQFKHHPTGQLFPTADALSEFLLRPVFTGRPRSESNVTVR